MREGFWWNLSHRKSRGEKMTESTIRVSNSTKELIRTAWNDWVKKQPKDSSWREVVYVTYDQKIKKLLEKQK